MQLSEPFTPAISDAYPSRTQHPLTVIRLLSSGNHNVPEHHRIIDTDLVLELWPGRRVAPEIMRLTLNTCEDRVRAAMKAHGTRRIAIHYECDLGLGGYVQMEAAILPDRQRAVKLSFVFIFIILKGLQDVTLQRHTSQSLHFRAIDDRDGLLAVGSLDQGTIQVPIAHVEPPTTR